MEECSPGGNVSAGEMDQCSEPTYGPTAHINPSLAPTPLTLDHGISRRPRPTTLNLLAPLEKHNL